MNDFERNQNNPDVINHGDALEVPKFTIRWRKKGGDPVYPQKPEPLSRVDAEAWLKQGTYASWTGEIIPWDEYLKEQGL